MVEVETEKKEVENKEKMPSQVNTSNPELADSLQLDPEKIEISKDQWDEVQARLKMLYEVADKGRIYNYESQTASGQKKPFKVKLSKFRDGYITGWRTVRDEAVYNQTTGKQMGEIQEYQILVLKEDGTINTVTLNGYSAFSEARYTERVECEVKGKKEDWEGKTVFDVVLPDGRVIPLDSRFVN